ncbi:MAG: hypothetical protein JJU06_05745 [Ectothiorhodospiraceae bacterium]|nr:hypothetical protein [Ectothiorhodospiraceae bacterium]MCH8502922.1 hypothetical protein [Ectothiorhodospiraceae bacterium]
MDELIDGNAHLIQGGLWQVRAFTLQETLRFSRNPKVCALIDSMAGKAERYLQLQDQVRDADAPLAGEAVDALCEALEGHDVPLVALTAVATDRAPGAIEALPAAEQAVLVLSMIAENRGFFGQRLAKAFQRQMSEQHSSPSAARA